MTNTAHNESQETARSLWRRRTIRVWAVGWTAFVGLALWWLLQIDTRSWVWIVHEAESSPPSAAKSARGFFTAEMGLQRVYPWVLFGPYVAFIAAFFPLERGRLRLNLPLNLAAGLAFVAASHAVNARTRMAFVKFTIIKSEPTQGGQRTNTTQIDISETIAGNALRERTVERPADRALPEILVGARQDASEGELRNLLAQMDRTSDLRLPTPKLPSPSLWSTLVDLLAYGAIAGLAHSIHFYRRFREREHRALALESNLANARLSALRAQLQPHFLFNSLNAIAVLLRRDPRLAETTLMSLSELLRVALSQSQRQETPLRDELEFVQRYLEIQQTRFGDKLRVEQDIEPEALDCSVPTLLLQPLVENAIRHGIEPSENAGLVRLTAHRRDGTLVVTVEDDGVGLNNSGLDSSVPKSNCGAGIGLANLRARLEAFYGAAQALDVIPRPQGGTTARVEIPSRPVVESKTDNRS